MKAAARWNCVISVIFLPFQIRAASPARLPACMSRSRRCRIKSSSSNRRSAPCCSNAARKDDRTHCRRSPVQALLRTHPQGNRIEQTRYFRTGRPDARYVTDGVYSIRSPIPCCHQFFLNSRCAIPACTSPRDWCRAPIWNAISLNAELDFAIAYISDDNDQPSSPSICSTKSWCWSSAPSIRMPRENPCRCAIWRTLPLGIAHAGIRRAPIRRPVFRRRPDCSRTSCSR